MMKRGYPVSDRIFRDRGVAQPGSAPALGAPALDGPCWLNSSRINSFSWRLRPDTSPVCPAWPRKTVSVTSARFVRPIDAASRQTLRLDEQDAARLRTFEFWTAGQGPDANRQSAARLLVTSMAEPKPNPTSAMLPARKPATRATMHSAEFQRIVTY